VKKFLVSLLLKVLSQEYSRIREVFHPAIFQLSIHYSSVFMVWENVGQVIMNSLSGKKLKSPLTSLGQLLNQLCLHGYAGRRVNFQCTVQTGNKLPRAFEVEWNLAQLVSLEIKYLKKCILLRTTFRSSSPAPSVGNKQFRPHKAAVWPASKR